MQDVQRQVRYPAAALRAQASGVVLVRLMVEVDGTLGEVSIIKSPSPLLTAEVLHAVKSLTGFTPARSYDQPVRGSLLCPVTFRITGNSTSTGSSRKPPLRGPVQPQAAPAAGNAVVEKVTSYWTGSDSYRKDKNGRYRVSVYQHYYTYDAQGWPATHTQESWASGEFLHFVQWRYEYGKAGWLTAKISKWAKSTFGYNEAGSRPVGLVSWARSHRQGLRAGSGGAVFSFMKESRLCERIAE